MGKLKTLGLLALTIIGITIAWISNNYALTQRQKAQEQIKQLQTEINKHKSEQAQLEHISKLVPTKLPPGERISLIYSIKEASKKFNIKPETIAAIIKVESNWNRVAKSCANAIGYMQVKKETAQDMMKKYKIPTGDLMDTYINIMCGTAYLRFLYDKFSKKYQGEALTIVVFVAYNRGHNSDYLSQNLAVLKSYFYVKRVEAALQQYL